MAEPLLIRALMRSLFVCFALLFTIPTLAPAFAAQPELEQPRPSHGDLLGDAPDAWAQVAQLRHAAIRLPIAAALASALAFRPRRRGTPRRQAQVIQTQI